MTVGGMVDTAGAWEVLVGGELEESAGRGCLSAFLSAPALALPPLCRRLPWPPPNPSSAEQPLLPLPSALKLSSYGRKGAPHFVVSVCVHFLLYFAFFFLCVVFLSAYFENKIDATDVGLV